MTHAESKQWSGKHREYKKKLVRANRSHAALIYDGADVVGWCQFGRPVELPGRMSAYGKMGLDRTTCFFVDRDHRREGVAKAALEGALRLITTKGGGTVDRYPIAVPQGKKNTRAHPSGRNRVNVPRPRIPSTRSSRHKQPGNAYAKNRSWLITSLK